MSESETRDLPHRVDVIVVGGGIEGTSVAYHVATRSSRTVLLLERGQLGAGETLASASMLAQQTGNTDLSRLARMSVEEYGTLGDEVGVQTTGSILYTSDRSKVRELEAQAESQNAIGIPSRFLVDPREIEQYYPRSRGSRESGSFVNAHDMVAAVFVGGDGFVDAHRTVQYFARRAREAGAQILEGTPVTGIARDREGERWEVRTPVGSVGTDFVVNAAGACAHEVGQLVGLDIPMGVNVRDVLLLRPPPSCSNRFPILEDLDEGWYFRPDSGRVLAGVGPPRDGRWFDGPARAGETGRVRPDPSALERLFGWLEKRAPPLSDSGLIDQWAGVRSISRDGLPILGPVRGLPGYLNCCAWSGLGVTCAAAGGRLIADVIGGSDGNRDQGTEPERSDVGPYGPVSVTPFLMDRQGLALPRRE